MKVRNFHARAQAALNAAPWPAGVSVTVDGDRAWVTLHTRDAKDRPQNLNVPVQLDPYDLTSGEPARVRAAAIVRARADAADQRYTDDSRARSAELAELLAAAPTD